MGVALSHSLVLEEAARLQPNHEQVSVALGIAYLQVNRGEDAFKSFLLVRRLYPNDFEWKPLPYEYEEEKLPIEILCGCPVSTLFGQLG